MWRLFLGWMGKVVTSDSGGFPHLKARLESRSDEPDFVPGVQGHLSVIITVVVVIIVEINYNGKQRC